MVVLAKKRLNAADALVSKYTLLLLKVIICCKYQNYPISKYYIFFLFIFFTCPSVFLCLVRSHFKLRLSLGRTSNKIYNFQTTANQHRFIKVWTSIADLPTLKKFVQTFFCWKSMATYLWFGHMSKFSYFFLSPL